MSVKITPRVRASSSYELQALMLAGAGIGCPPELVLRTDGPRATMDFDSLASQAYLQALSALNDLESALKQLPAAQRQAQIKELQPGLELAFQNWTLFANGFKDKATGAPADDELEKIFEAEISNAAFED